MQATHESRAGIVAEDHTSEPTIEDWARFVAFQPRLYFRPQDLDELKGFFSLYYTGPLDETLRVLGSLHSCSDICVSDAIIDVSDVPQTSSLRRLYKRYRFSQLEFS